MTDAALIDRLYLCLKDCSDDLAAELHDRYHYRDTYPSEQRNYEKAMRPVMEARVLLEELESRR